MPYTVIIHVAGEEAVVGELADLPGPSDTSILVNRVRRRDGKPVHYLAPGVTTVIWPMDRLTFIELVPAREARPDAEREDMPAAPAPAPAAHASTAAPDPPAASPAPTPEPEAAEAEEAPAAPVRAGGLLAQRRAGQLNLSRPPGPGGRPQ